MYERFTDRARKVIQLANQEAKRLNHNSLDTEHILLGLIKEGGGVAANVLKGLHLDLHKARLEIEKLVPSGPDTIKGKLPQTPRAKKVVEYSIEEARNLNHNYIGTEHLLLGLLREQEGVAAQVLMNLGLGLEDVRAQTLSMLRSTLDSAESNGRGNEGTAEKVKSKTPALDSFGRDLTWLARQGKLAPVIGRQNELERVLQVLSRATTHNPVLLGEAGVGKTAIVEGLAQLIVDSNVPELLRDRKIVGLDVALIVAGTKYRGQFEERVKAIINELRRFRNTILFVDDLHTVIGAGGADGVVEFFNLLKAALSRGEIQCIGATSMAEYRKFAEGHAALARCFQEIIVNPPSKDATLEILRGVKDRYEAYHCVQITDQALLAAVELSELYIRVGHFPVKALHLLDDAGARTRLKAMVLPPDLKELDAQIEQLNLEKEAAIGEQDFEKGARLRDRTDKLKKKKESITREWHEKMKEIRGVVDEKAIAEVVSHVTGIPIGAIESRDRSYVAEQPKTTPGALPLFERLQAESVLHGQDIEIQRGLGFVLLPHKQEFEALFEAVIRPAMASNGIEARKADDLYQPGSILAQVWTHIRRAEVIIADVSGVNPNVIFELGLSFGLHRCPILLVRNPEELPFNLRSLRYIKYDNSVAGGELLRKALSEAIQEFLYATRVSFGGP